MRRSLGAIAVFAVACSSTPPKVECAPGQTACGNTCADLQQDAQHCGVCGTACAEAQSCVQAACYANDCASADCAANQVCPSDHCVDRACIGVSCPSDQLCVDGTCRPTACASLQCASGLVCLNGACVDASCFGVLCPAGQVCHGGACASATCSDGLVGGGETDVDCGGPCPKCELGKACGAATDCQSGNCANGHCAAPTTCTNNSKDGTESDVDCGGGCPACPVGGMCGVDRDCASGKCLGGMCVVASTCSDTMKNGAESDADCGGGVCPKCADGKRCNAPGDCTSGQCVLGTCVNPTCTNNAKDGTETDTDCGGPSCAGCANGKRCALHRDCATQVCDPNTLRCTGPSCTDALKNQNETDVDCGGGTTCQACADGRACLTWSDCLSGFCVANTCSPGYAATVTPLQLMPTSVWMSQLAIGKFNGDACDDVAGTDRYLTFDTYVLLGSASGTLQPPVKVTLTDHPNAIDLADMNGDGKLDLVIATNGNSGGVALGTGMGSFQSPTGFTDNVWPNQIHAGLDVTGDGKADAVLGLSNARGVQILAGSGTGALTSVAILTSDAGQGGNGIAVARFNADTVYDLAVGREPSGIDIALGQGDGGFVFGARLPTQTRVVFLLAADLNKDQKTDLVATTQFDVASVFLGNGDGTFQTPADYPNVKGDWKPAIADLNGDGNLDFVSGTVNPGYGILVRLGTGNGGFLNAARMTATRLQTLGVGDVNCDGRPDVIAGCDNGTLHVFLQQ